MADLIARALACLCSLLLPSCGKHRATPAPAPDAAPVPSSRHRCSLPEHKSPYAREAAERRPFTDTMSPVRPYVLAEPRKRPDDPKRRAQAERLWALDMAARGIDVGPSVIHGVHVGASTRTVRVAVGV
ncbi:hypothetical protein [Streptomyces sp. NPDC059168]|uniref:hypothetical protein n=1 Tax=Streptomyces sp. NPDC059168 TaxID=3346753 RepID=UPI0036C0D6DC